MHGVATPGYARGGKGVDVGLVDRQVVVGECVVTGLQAQGTSQERCHLLPAHNVVGTEPVIGGRVAAAGDAGPRQSADGRFEEVAVVVDKVIRAWPEIEKPHEEGCHLASRDPLVRTVASVLGRVAPERYSCAGNGLDV